MAFPIENYLYGTFYGNTIMQYLIFFGFIAGAIILGKAAFFIFKTVFRVFTRKTHTEFDDIIINVIETPVILVILIIGLYLGYNQLSLPDYLHDFVWQFIKAIITLAIALFAIKLLDEVIEHYLHPLAEKSESDLDDHLVPLIRKVVKYSLIIITVLIILSTFGINVTSAVAGLGIGGLAVALAAQETLKNILGGIAILTDKPFKLGEWVEIGNNQGTVIEIGLRSTRLKTGTGEYVTIPNSIVASTPTVNYFRFPHRNLAFVLALDPKTSPEKIERAKKTVEKIIEETEKVVKGTVSISFIKFSNYSLDLDIGVEVDTNSGGEMKNIKDSINLRIKKEFEKEKISMAFFQQPPR